MKKHEEMIHKLINKLYTYDSGVKTNVIKLMAETGYDAADYEKNGELFAIYDEFCKAADAAGIKLDWSEYEGKDVGLPYNLHFIATWESVDVCSGIKPEDLDAISEALKKAESKVEITIERSKEQKITVTVGYDDDILDIDEDEINSMSLEELQEKLDEAESALSDLDDEEPDEEDEEAYSEWEDRYSMIEDLIDELEDRITELEDTEDD